MSAKQPRLREGTEFWEWTTTYDGNFYRSGACAGAEPCEHASSDAAREHQSEHLRHNVAGGLAIPIPAPSEPGDTIRACQANGCEGAATVFCDAGGFAQYALCARHKENVGWLVASDSDDI